MSREKRLCDMVKESDRFEFQLAVDRAVRRELAIRARDKSEMKRLAGNSQRARDEWYRREFLIEMG